MISAKIIVDSIERIGNNRLTTLKVVMPRIVLAEFNTHRALSRNSASSRAIPFKKMVEQVNSNPFIPIKWMKEHTGMQGTEYFDLSEPEELGKFRNNYFPEAWLRARDTAVNMAESMHDAGLTKQICNRLLEPFMWHKVLVSATEWQNFMSLRNESAAEIHIQEVAKMILLAMNANTPNELKPGEWHIPFGDSFNSNEFEQLIINHEGTFMKEDYDDGTYDSIEQKYKVKIATARCARISYETVGDNPKIDYESDLKLHDRLARSGHWSPFEHCAQAMTEEQYYSNVRGTVNKLDLRPNPGIVDIINKRDIGWSGNFRGFIQYRKTFKDENRTDSRLLKK